MANTKNEQKEEDLLVEMAEAIHPISEKIEKDKDHALFALGVKILGEGEEIGVQTYINATGLYGILAEGLYAELSDQISGGDVTLFSILRDVIRDLEEDMEISPDEEILGDDDVASKYH